MSYSFIRYRSEDDINGHSNFLSRYKYMYMRGKFSTDLKTRLICHENMWELSVQISFNISYIDSQ